MSDVLLDPAPRALAKRTSRPVILCFEGIDGVGKTTQAMRLQEWLVEAGYACHLTREPGGTALGEAIRAVLLAHYNEPVEPWSEALLYSAARAQHVQICVRPYLERGEIVILDRFTLSTLAYQGYGRGLDLERLRALNAWATGGLGPALTFLLDCEPRIAEERRRGSALLDDRLESEAYAFHDRVREGYRKLATADPSVRILEAAQSPDALFREVQGIVHSLLPTW